MRRLSLVLFFALIVHSGGLRAQLLGEFLYQPRVMLGSQDYELSIETAQQFQNVVGTRIVASEAFYDADNQPTSVSENLLSLGFGFSVIGESYFADVYVQESLDGEFSDDGNINAIDSQFQNLTIPNFVSSRIDQEGHDLERRDMAVSFGRAFENGIALSLGYKFGETTLGQDAAIGTSVFRQSSNVETSGPFVGVSYSARIGDYGSLGINLAVADLEATYEFRNQFVQQSSPDIFSATKGSSTGTAFGVNWTSDVPFVDIDGLRYAINLDYYDYEIDLEGDSVRLDFNTEFNNIDGVFSSPIPVSNFRSSLNETVTSVRVSLQYLF